MNTGFDLLIPYCTVFNALHVVDLSPSARLQFAGVELHDTRHWVQKTKCSGFKMKHGVF